MPVWNLRWTGTGGTTPAGICFNMGGTSASTAANGSTNLTVNGSAWWKQKEEFESFNGPIRMTTNCIVPPKGSYKDRLYTTGATGYPGCKPIPGETGEKKDFSVIIEHAKKRAAPTEIETGEIIGSILQHKNPDGITAFSDFTHGGVQFYGAGQFPDPHFGSGARMRENQLHKGSTSSAFSPGQPDFIILTLFENGAILS